MEYETAIQAFEARKGKGPFGLFGNASALIIKIVSDEAHPIESEMRHVNYHFMNWLARHGNQCADLVLEFIAPISSRPAIEGHVSRLLLQDCQFNDIINRLDMECTIQDPQTGETYRLAASVRPGSTAPPPPMPPPLPVSAPPHRDDDRYLPSSPAAEAQADASMHATFLGVRDPSLPGKEVLLFKEEDAALAAGVEEAQRRIPEFKALLDSPQAGVTVRIPWECGDVHDIYEASLVGRNGDELEAEFTPDYAPGPIRKTYRFAEILDWTVYHQNGQKTGGFTTAAPLPKTRK